METQDRLVNIAVREWDSEVLAVVRLYRVDDLVAEEWLERELRLLADRYQKLFP